MKLFELERDIDVSGISGIGIVAQGVVFDDNTVAMRWIVDNQHSSTVLWDNIDAAMAIHGHNGSTRIVWIGAGNDKISSKP